MSDLTEQNLFAENVLNPTILPTLHPFSFPEGSSGIFAVGETGKVSFDLLFDKKRVNGDLGLFRLEGMESLEVESEDFIREAIRRTISNSDLGRLIFSDRAIANEIDSNTGKKTLTMNPGETFALAFFSEGIENAIAHHIPPILSLASTQFADMGDGRTVAIEAENGAIDALTGQLDIPYTDLIFCVEGATGQLEKLDILVSPEQNWRNTSLGENILISTSKSSVEIEEKNIFEAEELERNSHQESQVLNVQETHNIEIENGDRAISKNLSEQSLVESKSEGEIYISNIIETKDNNIGSYLTNKQTEKEIATGLKDSSQSEQTEDNIEITQSSSSQLNQSQKAPKDPFTSGVFTVGESGEIGFDFLFDGGKYKSELAIFSLDGMGEIEFGSTEFIEEAARRALSGSEWGHIVVRDREEGAKFNGELGEKSWNKGEYQGVKTFKMKAGDRFGVMLIPNGTVKKVHQKPNSGGAKKPLFSLAIEGNDFGQIADLNGEGHTFAMEDVQPNHKWFDRDYNDIIFQVIGATGTAQSFDKAINPEKDWRPTELGQEILDYIKSPETITEKVKFIVDSLYNPGESLSISGLVSDEDGEVNISRVDFWLQKDGGEWVDIDDALVFVEDRDRVKFRYQLGELDPGKYRIKATPYDDEGKVGEIYEDAFTVLSVSQGEELSDRVKMAIERSMNLQTYDPHALAKTTEWIVSVQKGVNVDSLAVLFGAKNLGETGQIANTYRWQFARGVDPHAIAERLKIQVGIEFAYPLVPLNIQWHSSPSDEPYVQNGKQWHLDSNAIDVNVADVWEQGIFGNGQTIGIVDSGFELHDHKFGLVGHPDLVDNYRTDLSWDFAENDAIASRLVRQNIYFNQPHQSILEEGQDRTYSTPFPLPGHNYFQFSSYVEEDISNLWVDLDIEHDSVSTLDVYLVSPERTEKQLSLDAEGNFSGYISEFNGEDAEGKWVIKIIDRNPQDGLSGTLKNLVLRANSRATDHGTKVAGVAIADGKNGLWGTGIAPDAEWAALRMGSRIDDGNLANILLDPNFNLSVNRNHQIEVFNNSWGLGFYHTPSGRTYQHTAALTENAIENGGKYGRQGLGNVYIFSAGNNAQNDANVNYNSLANSRHTIAVAAIDPWSRQTQYSEIGSPVFVSAYSSAGTRDNSDRPVVTTGIYSPDGDDSNDYTISSYGGNNRNDFGGTSAAAPFVSGVAALMLEANPNLTSRDVQHILANTSNWQSINDPDAGWTGDSGDSLRHSHKYGFGVVDAAEAVEMAKTWTSVKEEISVGGYDYIAADIPDYNPNNPQSLISTINIAPEDNLQVEWVEVLFNGNHSYLGDLELVLTSPDGTESILAQQHSHNQTYQIDQDIFNWAFTSVRHWGESAAGEWSLEVTDRYTTNTLTTHWTDWTLNLYGTAIAPMNTAPTLTQVATLDAIENKPFSISYADLLAASDATDADGDPISFIIEALNSGTLTQGGEAIALGTQISEGDVLQWTPDNAGDDISAFSIKASDGVAESANAIDVTVDVADSYTPVKIGDEFAINTHTEKGQWGASVTALNDGGFVVTWTSWEQDGVQGDIYAQRHDRDGNKVGGEFQINTTTVQMQTAANVTTLQDGTFLVTWHSFEQDGSDEAIIGRRYDAQGNPLTNEFQINTRTEFDQETPNIEAFGNGGFVVVWITDEDGNNGYAVYGQRYNGAGEKVGDEFRANTYNLNEQITPRVAVLDDDSFVVTWWSKEQDGTKGGIYAQRYGSDGNRTGQEFRVNTETIYSENDPAIATLENGGFVIAWTSGLPGQGIVNGIHGQLYDRNGNAVGGELQLSDASTGQYTRWPKLTSLQDGGFVATWESWSDSEVYGRRFSASGTPLGEQFRVNDYTDGKQNGGEMATLKDGNFVVTWASEGQDGDDMGIYGRIFEVVAEIPKGKIGEEFKIDSQTGQSKVRPFVTTLQDGSFIATWESPDGDNKGNFGQRYDALGNSIGQEFQINAKTYHRTRSAVSSLDDGGFIVTWQSQWGEDGSYSGIFAQRYDADSNPIAEEFQVNTYSVHSQEIPAIATLTNGEYVIIWQSFDRDGSGQGIYGQRFDRHNTPLGTEFALNTQTEGHQRYPELTALKAGGFVATWTSESQDGNNYDIYARRYDVNGNALGQEFLVNTHRTNSQYAPAIATLEDGSFVISWQSIGQDDNSTSGIYGQRYDSNGDRIGTEFQVNTISQSDQLNPAIAPLSNGGFAIVWQSKGHFVGIHGQRYDSNGDRVGEEFRIDPETYSFRIMPVVAGLPDGKFVTLWQSLENNIWDIYGQILSNDPETESSENTAPELSLVHLNPVNASHVGSTDPVTEGWNELLGSQNTISAVNDGGVEAWHIQDTSTGFDSTAGYHRRISFAEATLANIYGWKISADLKLGEQAGYPNGSVKTIYHGGATGYALLWGANSEGDLLLQYAPEDYYITHTLEGVAANEYHRTEMIFDPETNTAKILVDGNEIVTNYKGSTASSDAAEILQGSYFLWGSGWGSGTGDAYWKNAQFEVLKPTATQGNPYTITYEELLAASDATDANGDEVSFILDSIENGTLTKNGQTVISGETLSQGEEFVWTPESSGIDIAAFTIKATDGQAISSTPVSVTLDVQAIPQGATTGEIQVNTYTDSSQSRPVMATLADGSYVVTWQSYGQDGSAWGVFAQRYDALGNPLSQEFQINTETASTQEHPSIAALPDGGFIIAWESLNQDGSGKGIFAQRFNGTGEKIAGEFQVNAESAGEQLYPAIASLNNGDFVITWQSEGQDGSNFGIFGQRYDSQGNTLGNEFQINTTTANDQSRPAISSLPDGGFLITWSSEGQDGDFEGIYGQRYNVNGFKVGSEFNLNTYSNGSQYVPSVTSLEDGGFVVAWQSEGQDGSAYGIYGRRFDSSSNPVGEEFRINTEVSQHQVNPAIALLSNGGFVVTWQSYQQDGSNYGIHGQRFDSQGQAIGDEFQINTSTGSRQILPSVTPLDNGTFVVAWHSHIESGDNYTSVFSRIFGNEPETATTGNIAPQLNAIALAAPEYNHQGNTDPTTEGWINTFNIQDGNILRAVDDNGIAAWSTNDDSSTYLSGGGYSRIFSWGETVIADKYGWKMSANLKIVDSNDNPGGSIQATYQNGFDHYQIFWGSNAEGDVLIHGVTDEMGERSEYTLTGVKANEYHDYEMIFDPQTKTLKVLVDGVEKIGNYGGYTASNSSTEHTANQQHIFWGSASSEDMGEAYWQSVNFETLKPKATQGNPYTITYEELLAASDATDANGDDLAFVITSLDDGTLSKNGQAVIPGNTTLSKGEKLLWTPNSAGDDVAAFTVKATDGNATSSTPVSVTLDVQAIPQGATTGEIQVNTYTDSSQSRPVMATLADGSYVVTWQSYGQDSDRWGVFAQRYDALGNPLSQEFQINTETSSYQEHPSIAALSDGGFIVAWESLHQDGSGKGIFAQRFNGTGEKIAGEFQVNRESAGEQIYPAIASLNNGDFVITWQSEGQDGSAYGIFGQRYDSQGNTLGNEFQINTTTVNDQNRPAMSALNDGGFLVTWASDGQDGDFEGIYGQRYDANGVKVGGEFNINTYSKGSQYVPSVTSLEDGGFAIAWQSEGQDGSAYGIYGRRFDSSSNPVGEEFRVNTEVSQHQVNPAIALLSNGGFVVTWQSFYQDGSHYDIYGQRFDSNGNAVGDEFQINTTISSRQMMPSVTPLDNGTFVVAWQSHVQDGDDYAVVSRIFGNDPETTTTQNFAPQLSAIALTPPQHSHQGSTDPTTERWMLSLKDGNTVGAINDNGIEAWSTNDDLTTSGSSYYYRTLSRGESIIADTYGWKLSANLKVVELNDSPAGSIITSYRNGFEGYQLHWGSNADGDVLLRVLTDENSYETHTLTGVSANEYRDYDLIFDPETKTVKVLVDGVEKISNYGGYNASGSNEHAPTNRQQIFWGAVSSSDTGEAYWQKVNFETLKPKATQGSPYTITYEELLAASDATDANGDDLAFVITSLDDGTLSKNGQAVIPGNTTLSKGEKLLWTPNSVGDDVAAFTVKASDGQLLSGDAVKVAIDVTASAPVTPVYKIGEEFQVNTHIDDAQVAPSVTALKDGGFLVAWQSNNQDGSNYGIYAQRYDNQSNSVGNEFQVNSYTNNSQSHVKTTTLEDGGFLITWYSFGQDGSSDGIYAQRYDSQSNSVGNEFKVNSFTDGAQRNPNIAALKDGGFLITWRSHGQDGSSDGIYAQRYDSQNNSVGSEFKVNSYTDLSQSYPSVAAFEDGGFLISWGSWGQDGNNYGIYAQRYDSQSNPVGSEFQINSFTDDSQAYPSVTVLKDGGFFITWVSSGQDGSDDGIYFQRYDSRNNPVGNEFQVNSYTNSTQFYPSGTALEDGGFLITWQSEGQDGSGYGIYAQRYDRQGNPVDSEFQVNSYTDNSQWHPSVTVLKDGDAIIAWDSHQDGSISGIFAQRFGFTSSANIAPELSTITPFTGATATQPYTITYADLLAASDATDVDGDALSFRIESVISGSLTQNGNAVNIGAEITATDTLVWTPDSAGNALSAFSVKAYDGQNYSENSAIVPITVNPLPSQQVTVTVHRIAEVDNIDWADLRGGADFRTNININGIGWTSPIQDDGDDISPNWQFSQDVTGATIPISIKVDDDDSYDLGFTIIEDFEDVDVNPLSGNTLNLTYNLLTGEITGSGVNGVAGEQIQVRGGGGDANRADLWFSIDSVTPPYKIGGEFQVNSQTENDQTYPAIAALKNGGFAIVWPSQNGSDWDIYGQRYDNSGNKIGGEFLVNSNTSSFQQGADIVGLENGGFIVTWQSFNPNSADWDIYGQRYNGNGEKVSDEFLVNTNTFDQQRNQAITALKNGGFVITWEDGGQNNDYSILGQLYDENGIKIGDEFTANSHAFNNQLESNVAALNDGGFVITWESELQDGSGDGIYAQRYNSNGNKIGGEFQVNSQTFDWQETANLTALKDGGFVIAWESQNQDGNSYGIYAQRYNSNGEKVGGEFQVNSHTNQAQRNPSIASLQDGGYLIAWTSQGQDGSGEGIYAQRYDSNGNKVAGEIQVNSHTLDSQSTPDIVTLADGSLVITWDSQNQDGSDRGIFAQRFGIAPTTPPAPQLAPPSPSVFHHLNQAYNSLQDSPFPEGASLAPLRVETFEDGALDTLGVTASTGSIAFGTPHSIEDNGGSWQVDQNNLTFSFDANLLGTLPTRAGVAVTDIANADIGSVAIEAFDSQGISLGVTQPEALGSGDRFFGVEYEGGISKAIVTANSNDWNIDHLQYG